MVFIILQHVYAFKGPYYYSETLTVRVMVWNKIPMIGQQVFIIFLSLVVTIATQ